jgi:integrase
MNFDNKRVDVRTGSSVRWSPRIYECRSLQWLIERYRQSADWTKLSTATRRQRENIFLSVISTAGDEPFAQITIGTRERLALAVFLYTGLRRGDVARLGRRHVRNGVISLRTEKTKTIVTIPIIPELQAVIDQSPTGDLVFVASRCGKPMTKESLGNWFKDACKAAGVPGSAHGLRKAGATRLANNVATVAQLEAIYGWEGGKMASLYTRTAHRAHLAREAMGKLARPETGTSIPAPCPKVRASGPKNISTQRLILGMVGDIGIEPMTPPV